MDILNNFNQVLMIKAAPEYSLLNRKICLIFLIIDLFGLSDTGRITRQTASSGARDQVSF